MIDILMKNKEVFHLENYAKLIERNLAAKTKKQEKEQENLKRKSVIYEAGGEEPYSPNKIHENTKKNEEKKQVSKEACWSITDKFIKFIKKQVLSNLKNDQKNITLLNEAKKHRKIKVFIEKNEGFKKKKVPGIKPNYCYFKQNHMKFIGE